MSPTPPAPADPAAAPEPPAPSPSDSRQGRLDAEFEHRRERALAMGGAAKLARRRAQGVLNARERIGHLFDAGSFIESGLCGRSAVPEDIVRSPGDGNVAGGGRR
ncbi:MAG: acetyl-CoA carboxylase carboxyltransferase subunit, partial [Betaproteobacteria bacterium]